MRRVCACLAFHFLIVPLSGHLSAQAPYVAPTDPLVKEKLAQWRDLKFGLLMHWGPYSQWGVVESWSICPEDEGWCRRDSSHGATYTEYVQNYEALQTTFDPVRFDPTKWAKAAKEAGMKYMVFTTKHHDGFCMFDTKTTDYRITSPKTPFHDDVRANVTNEIFTAFRKEGLWTGAYFSKPDWHNDNYWWRNFPPKDRSVNYLPAKYPERWKAFQDCSYTQIEELMSDYGKMDILWLDGGWVRPFSSIDTSVSWQKAITIEQDIDMPRIAAMARAKQPGLLVVDRTVGGEFENYITPEGHVPEKDPGVPWETCMPMGTSWSWVPNEQYKSTDDIIRTLVQVVSRGGSLLLNVAPGPDGQLDSTAYMRLKEVGEWLKVNGEAGYLTRAMAVSSGTLLGGTERVECIRKVGSRATHLHEDYRFPSDSAGWVIEVPWLDRKLPRVSVVGSTDRIPSTWNGKLLTIELPESVIPSKSVIKLTYRTHAIVCGIRF
ncbi:MAG: alpha-L-fucosidase [Flavobacteriales bacterium]|nr:alpha-L-fucosidase [Flavobacteriales bacterium]